MNRLNSILVALAILIITTIGTVGASRNNPPLSIDPNQQLVDWQQIQLDQQKDKTRPIPTPYVTNIATSDEMQRSVLLACIVVTSLVGVCVLLLLIVWILVANTTLLDDVIGRRPTYTSRVIPRKVSSYHPDYVNIQV